MNIKIVIDKNLTRVMSQKLIEQGNVKVNGKNVKTSYKLNENDKVEVEIPEVKEVSIEDVVKKVVKRNFRNFLEKNIKLQLTDIKETVFCDPKWMEFIINQVISNSIKYCNTKGAVIKIYAVNEKNFVSLNIEDNGVGIVERDLKRVFEKGFTGENGRLFGMSTGMGLYLCKKLCNKLGLAISISSQEEKGTIVMIVFPKNNFVIK